MLGGPIDPSSEAVEALLDVWPPCEAFQSTHVCKGLLLKQEETPPRHAGWRFGGSECCWAAPIDSPSGPTAATGCKAA